MSLENVARALVSAGCISFEPTRLKGQTQSPYYIDLGKLYSHPREWTVLIDAYRELVGPLPSRHILGVPERMTSMAAALAFSLGRSHLVLRVKPKDHGNKGLFIGDFQPGDQAVLVDDVITSGKSFSEIIETVQQDLVVKKLAALIDREEGGVQNLQRAGYRVHTYTKAADLFECMGRLGLIKDPQLSDTLDFISSRRSAQLTLA